MSTVYAVSTIAVRRMNDRKRMGWVRVGIDAEQGDPNSAFYLRDGSVCREAEVLRRIREDPTLLYRTRREAVEAGIARLREAEAPGN
jgi:hypothetical protein